MEKVFRILVSAAVILSFAGCSDNDEPGGESTYIPVDGVSDIVHGNMVYVMDFANADEKLVEVNTQGEVDVEIPDDSPLAFTSIKEDDKNFICVSNRLPVDRNIVMVPVKVAPKGCPSEARNIIIVAKNMQAAESGNAGRASGNAMLSVYSESLGKGTVCFNEVGNTTESVILYDRLSELGEKYVSVNTTANVEKMFELNEATSSSMMESYGVNVGVNFKKAAKANFLLQEKWIDKYSVSGSFTFGIGETFKESHDYEYYMNIYTVRKAEVKILMDKFRKSNNNPLPDSLFLALVNPDYIRQIVTPKDSTAFNAEEFLNRWGTDVITQAQFGGRCLYIYGRKENVYEHSLAVDASAEMTGSRPSGSGEGWVFIYTSKNSPYIKGSFDVSYKNSSYNSASKAVSYYDCVGGNMNDNDAAKWIDGFNDSSQSDKWSVIGYRLSSDVPSKDENDPDWSLTQIEDIGLNVVNIYDTMLGDRKTPKDSAAIKRVTGVLTHLSNERVKYMEKHSRASVAKSPIVVADFIMRDGKNGHKKGEPSSFIDKDVRTGEYRIYYPLMANKFSPYDVGYAVETTQNDYYPAILDNVDHYWYYSLDHSSECDGIVDIKFVDDTPDYYYRRGDDALPGGCSGQKNYVCLKFGDSETPDSEKIKAIGLYKRDDKSGTFDPNRIFASTGGSELRRAHTQREYDKWHEWWNSGASYVKTQWNEGGFSPKLKIWPCYSTKPLDESVDIRDVCHPLKWGE